MSSALRSLSTAIATLFAVAALTFFLIRFTPGGPFDTERVLPPEIMENIAKRYGLDLPIWEQFKVFLTDALHGDLRESFQYIGKPVTEILTESMRVSVPLGLMTLFFSLVIGVGAGAYSAWKRGSGIDFFISLVSSAGMSIPGYLAASLLVVVFSMWLRWFPPALWEEPSSMVLPVIALSIRPISLLHQMTRSSLLECLGSDYIRTAFSKGLGSFRVVSHHALRNALIPIIGIIGPIVANVVTGSFIVETVFQIPGLGRHFVTAVLNRDYPLVTGITILYGIILIGANLLSEWACLYIDPRIRGSDSKK